MVYLVYELNVVFECKYEFDFVVYFLVLGNEFYK